MTLDKPPSIENPAKYEILSLFRGSILSYMVGFYIFAFYLELHFRIPALQALRFQFTYGAIVGFFCLLAYLKDADRSSPLNSVTKITFWLIAILGVYTIFSMDREESMWVYKDRVIKFSLVSFFIYAATQKIEDLRVIIAFMLLAWLKMGQEGFWGWFSGNLVWENQGIPRLHGSTAMYGHPNSFSGFAVSCLPFGIFLFMSAKSKLLKAGLLALILFSLIIIVTTGSRTGYVAVILGAAYFFFKLKIGKLKILSLAIIVLFATINLVPHDYKERFMSIFSGQEKEGRSSEARLEIIQDALILYSKYPLGVGVQAFPEVRQQLFGRVQNTHNLYLEVLTNIGPLGLIIFCLFVYKIIKTNIVNIRKLSDEHLTIDQLLLLNICKAVIGYILLRLILGLFGMDLYEIYWWVALGLTLSVTKLIKRLPNKEDR